MTHFEKPLESLTAGDLMSPKLITVPEDMPLAKAARLLADADVRGAPVMEACCWASSRPPICSMFSPR